MDNLHLNSKIIAESRECPRPNTPAREDPTEMGSENPLQTMGMNRKRRVPVYMRPTGLNEKVEGVALPLDEKMDCKGVEIDLAPDHSSGPMLNRPKYRRMLFTDPTKISSKDMRAQLSDVTDILQSLELAPPTKELMRIRGTDYVHKLFALPGRPIPARSLLQGEEMQQQAYETYKQLEEYALNTHAAHMCDIVKSTLTPDERICFSDLSPLNSKRRGCVEI